VQPVANCGTTSTTSNHQYVSLLRFYLRSSFKKAWAYIDLEQNRARKRMQPTPKHFICYKLLITLTHPSLHEAEHAMQCHLQQSISRKSEWWNGKPNGRRCETWCDAL
jgi:hypothetical protein